jgi:prepilin peptidase CpaA
MSWPLSVDVTSTIGIARFLVLGALAVGACIWDLRFRQIPNWLTASTALVGLVLAVTADGWHGAGWALSGLLVGGGLFILPVALEYIGAGDLKLMAAAGTLLGPLGILHGMLLGAIFGGIWALGWIVAKGRGKSTLPYAPPLALGVVMAFSIG